MAKKTNKHGLKSKVDAPLCDGACDPKQDAASPAPESRAEGRQARGLFAPGNAIGELTKFGEGNQAAREHGVRAFEDSGALPPALVEQRAADVAGIVTDLGGPTELTTAQRLLVEQAGHVSTIVRLYAAHIEQHGPFTSKGRVRATTAGLLAAVDRLHRLLVTLGLERRARKAETLEDWLKKRAEAASEAASTATGAQAAGADDRQSSANLAVDRTAVGPESREAGK